MIEHFQSWARQWRRGLFITANLLVVGSILGAFTYLSEALRDQDSEIAEKGELLARFQSVVLASQDPRQPQQLDLGEFLSGSTDGVIGADLQTRLKGIADRNGTQIRTMQSEPAKVNPPLKYIGTRITVAGTLQRVKNTVAEIEASKPYLSIPSAVLRLTPAPGTQEPLLEAQLEVVGATIENEKAQ